MRTPQRVAVTGLGVLAANGIGKEPFWDSLLAGVSGVGPITLFDPRDCPCKIAGEVKEFDPSRFIEPRHKPHRMSRCTQLAVAAAKLALEDSGLGRRDLAAAFPLPLILGVSTSAPDMWEKHRLQIERRGPANGPPYIIGAFMPHAAVNAIARCLEIETRPITMASACTAGMDAIGAAAELIRTGQADVAIAGGADAAITFTSVTSFFACGLVSATSQEPEKASRPFDRRRECGILAEGAAVLVLENLDHARARGGRPYLEIAGCAMNTDSNPERPGAGLEETMTMALANAGCYPDTIDYINAQAPGDPLLDCIEVEAIKSVFCNHAYRIPVSSIKGNTGNPLAAGGVNQVAACGLIFLNGLIPPVANLEEPDPACDLDLVRGAPRAATLSRTLINNHGLGGRNFSMVVERTTGP